jgi:hypothetical protein
MPFSYYARLSEAEKQVYRASDRVAALRLSEPQALRPRVEALRRALVAEDRDALRATTTALCQALTAMLEVPPVELEVLSVRPRSTFSELHGLYTHPPGQAPCICVWMRTAMRGRVVAFRTYLRTVLHELCHHLDFTLLKLPASFHTQGFFQRESSLFHQLAPPAQARLPHTRRSAAATPLSKRRPGKPPRGN